MAEERYNPSFPAKDTEYFNIYKQFVLEKVSGRVLDLGCGEGWLTIEMAHLPKVNSIMAVDRYNGQPDINKNDKITYKIIDINKLNLKEKFDTIVSTEFIEHITKEDLKVLLVKIASWLKKDGVFIGSTPNVTSHSGNPYHLMEYSNQELQAIFNQHGFIGEFQAKDTMTLFKVWQKSA